MYQGEPTQKNSHNFSRNPANEHEDS